MYLSVEQYYDFVRTSCTVIILYTILHCVTMVMHVQFHSNIHHHGDVCMQFHYKSHRYNFDLTMCQVC